MPTEDCPHCGANLQGEPIPQEYIDEGYYSPGSTHYRREIGIEVRGVYDGILYWQCPDCFGTWHRWPEGSEYWHRAVRFIGTEGTVLGLRPPGESSYEKRT